MEHSILLATRMSIMKSQSVLLQDKCVVIFQVSFPITRTCCYPGLFDTCAPMIVIRKWPDYVWHIGGVLVTRREQGRNMDWDAKKLRYFRTGCLLSLTKYHKIPSIEFHVPQFANGIIWEKWAVRHWHNNTNVAIQQICSFVNYEVL